MGAICHLPTSKGWYEGQKDEASDFYPGLVGGRNTRALELLGYMEFYKQPIHNMARGLLTKCFYEYK